jgi:hypothetical protein
MKIKYFTLLLLVLISCQKKELSEDFRNEIIQYQKSIPLPSKKDKYIYVANFFRDGNDTLFNLIRCSGLSKYDNVSGVYSDELLKPLAIIDKDTLGSKNYYLTKKSEDIQYYIRLHLKEDFPPLYRYKIKNKKIILMKVDTIGLRWEK